MHDRQAQEPVHPKDTTISPAMDEETRIASLNANLTTWFNRHRNMRCFLAVDPSQRDVAGGDAEDQASFANLPRAKVVIDHDAFPEEHCPYLLELDLATPSGLEALAQSVRIALEDRHPISMAEGLGQRVGGWLASSASLIDVAAHWSRLALRHDDSGRARLLRFYDSRALALLWTVFSPAQQQAMLGPVKAWHVLDAVAKPGVHLASSDSQEPFLLSAEQWQDIDRHGLVNRAIALHARTCARQPEAGEIEVAVAAAKRADQYGLIDRDDCLAFIGHALAWHPHFDSHPTVTQILDRRAVDSFYTAEIGELSAEEIDDIRQGSW